MGRLKDSLDNFLRRIEMLPIPVAGVIGLTAGLLMGMAALLKTGGDWGLALFGVALVFPALLGLVARPVMVPDTAVDEPEPGPPAPEETPSEPVVPPLLDMVPVPAGRFVMGSDKDDPLAQKREFPAHRVNLGAFLMARTPPHSRAIHCGDG